MARTENFAAFILAYGRPDKCFTYDTLRRRGYTGRIVLICDDTDKHLPRYLEKYGDEVVVFDKAAAAAKVDKGDNRPGLGTAMFARNACFDIAKDLGLDYFVQLDDDYTGFQYRFDDKLNYCTDGCYELDAVFRAFVNFMHAAPAVASISMAQGGDFAGGALNEKWSQVVLLKRKCMNSWFCATDRRFSFSMRMNDDVTTYVLHGMRGRVFLTANQVSLVQLLTQATAGGMTEFYRDAGTYVKTFYTVMAQPSSVKVGMLHGRAASRIHHKVDWKRTVPVILREKWRKA